VLQIILAAPVPQILVYFTSATASMYTIRMQIRPERSYKSILLALFPFARCMTENMVPLYTVLFGIHAVINVLCEDAP
jgi:hypothetical protein